jgi:hypothetical protein
MKPKPFKESKIGRFLSDKAPKILDIIGEVLPDKGVLGVVKNLIDKDDSIPAEQKLEFEKLIQEYEKEMFALETQDRDSARNMQAEALKQQDPFSKRFIYYFSIFWSWFSALYLASITFIEIPKENVRVVDTVLGFILGTAIAAMFSFFYGSSIPRDTLKTGLKDGKTKWF